MLAEAELFVMAEQMLAEVLGRIREQDRELLLPHMWPGAGPLTMREAVQQHAESDARVPLALTGRAFDPYEDVVAAACAAAAAVVDGSAVVPGDDGDLPVREHLLRLTLARSLLAHYVAAHLGSTACPLPEELARPLWELTAPDAQRWRELGWFRPPMPLPDHVSWRDRFLLTAGHEPHPLGH